MVRYAHNSQERKGGEVGASGVVEEEEMKHNRDMLKEMDMRNTEKQILKHKAPPVVIKIMIEVDGRDKVIKTVSMLGPESSAGDVVANARLEMGVFKQYNPHLAEMVKAEVTFKMVI